MWVRRRSPRKSSVTEFPYRLSHFLARAQCAASDLFAREVLLFARRHILQGVAAGGHFVVAHDQAKRAPSLLASSMARFSLPSHQFHATAGAAQLARQHAGVAQRRLAQRRNEQSSGAACVLAFHAHHQAVFADGKTDARRVHLRAQRFRQPVVAAAAQHGILRAQRAVHHFERGAHVVIEAAHHARPHFVSDAAVVQIPLAPRRNARGRARTDDRECWAACR